MTVLDTVIVLTYIAGTTLLGAWFSRRQKTVSTYFVGDRNVPWWLVLISIVATETSTVTFLSIPGVAYDPGVPARGVPPGNLTFLQLAFGYILGRIIVAVWLLPQYMRGELFSAYQVLKMEFSPTVQRTASALFVITRTLVDGLRLCLTALLLHLFTGWDIAASIITMGVVTILYTYLGGMEAVIWTDLVQFVVYVSGAILALVMLVRWIPGGWGELLMMAGRSDKLQLIDASFDLTKVRTLWAGLIGGTFVSMASHGADQNMVQRYLCARSLGQAQIALVLSGFLILAQFTLFQFIGLGLWASSELGCFTVPPGTRNDEVFGFFIVHHLPTGIVGVLTAAVLASAMASFSSSLNSAANAIVTDFYRPIRPNRSEEHYLHLSKLMTAAVGFSKVGVAIASIGLIGYRSVVDQVLALAAVTTGLILGLYVLGSLPRVVRGQSAIGGMIAGFVVTATFWLKWLWDPTGGGVLAWPWFAPLGTSVTISVAWLLDIVSRKNGSSHD